MLHLKTAAFIAVLLTSAFCIPTNVAPIILNTTTTTTTSTPRTVTTITTQAPDSRTLYLSQYFARDGFLFNTYCNNTAVDAAHSVMTLRTNICSVFPGITNLGLATYYLLTKGPGTDQYILRTGCNSFCQGCSRNPYTLTLGVCANSIDFPSNESVLLTSSSCEGGLYSASYPDNVLSAIHMPYSDSCQFDDTDEVITNLGPADGSCGMVHGMYVKVESTGSDSYSLWWNCNQYCAGCTFTKLNMTFETCLSRVQTGLPGTVMIKRTSQLATCGPQPESAKGLSTAAIVGIVIGSVVGVAGLIGLGLWLAQRRRRHTYEPISPQLR